MNESINAMRQQLHNEACLRGEDTYKDPQTGASVFTAVFLERSGICCEAGCRHCPFGYNVDAVD